ncbi:hypothetical protein OKW23_000247 [Bacilli bacterium PM5-9]|nr:hypothetical protein [Bacilli bacterium PM5-9]
MVESQKKYELNNSNYLIEKKKSFDGSEIVIELKDESEDSNFKMRSATNGGWYANDVIKEYGARRFTASYSNGVNFKFVSVNRYKISNKGLTFTSVSTEGTYYKLGTWSTKLTSIPDRTATQTGHDIDSLVVFKHSMGIPNTPFSIGGEIYLRSYIKIKKWDVRKKYMVLTQKAKWNLY